MQASNDPRAQKFFEPNDEGNYTGGVSGTNFSTSQDYRSPYFCRPVFKYDMPVYLITVSEIEFFKAEYYARYGTAADAELMTRQPLRHHLLLLALVLLMLLIFIQMNIPGIMQNGAC